MILIYKLSLVAYRDIPDKKQFLSTVSQTAQPGFVRGQGIDLYWCLGTEWITADG